MKFAAAISALATVASAASIKIGKPASPLDVKIEMFGNTGVKASITNTGSEDLKVFKTGSFLDKRPTQKVKVTQGASKVAFNGMRLRVKQTDLKESAFQVIPAGKTVVSEFDVAQLHDLSAGGDFEVAAEGALQYAKAGSNDITGFAHYSTSLIKTTVDGFAASKVFKAFHANVKRMAVQSDCTGSEESATVDGVNNCYSLATAAADAASSDDARLEEYFKSSDSSTRSYVVNVFNNVASECGSTTSGAPYYCTDVYQACSDGVIAYTLPSEGYMVNCPIFFDGLPAASSQCHAQDQQTTILHESTHLLSVAGTDDYGGYGYDFIQSLSSEQNLNHADTYTLFAQSIYAGC